MSMLRSVLAVALIGTAAAGMSMGFVTAAGAAEQGGQQFSPGVAKALKAAQDATKKGQWNVALEKIKEAQAQSGKTAYDEYQIDNFLAYVLYSQKKIGEAAVVYERMLNSGMMPANEVETRTKSLAQMFFTLKQYDKAIKYSKQLYDKNPNQQDVALVLGQAYYLSNDCKNAVAVMNGLVTRTERAGRTPDEDWLRLVYDCQGKLNDKAGVIEALKKLVRHHNKPDDWSNLLSNVRGKGSDRVDLGYFRLMREAGVLKRDRDYFEFAQLAMDEKVGNAPAEAVQIIQEGIDKGILKSDDKAQQGRYDRLFQAAKQRAQAMQQQLPQLAKQTEAAENGQADVALGQAYLGAGNYDAAIQALQRGIKRGGVTDVDEAQIDLGYAYLKKGQKDQARQAFRAVSKDSEWATLAELWALRV
ncbi:MAG TPA: tetratricopeptide repeat protein [Steroidobacteraceae bacterium]